MRTVRTLSANFVYRAPLDAPEVRDLHCQVDGPFTDSVWEPTPIERAAIARGANIGLRITGHPIPPVAVYVTEEQGIGEDSPAYAQRLRELRGQPV